MNSHKALYQYYASTSLFVLIWGSGAIFSRWGLNHASAFAFLSLRFAIALIVLLLFAIVYKRRFLPQSGTPLKVTFTGIFIIGGYSICYFLALENNITPGVLATLLGVQPIITLLIMERRFSLVRLAGLILSLTGLILVVLQSLLITQLSFKGICFALAALLCACIGAILQKGIKQAPSEILPLKYAISLELGLVFVPFKPFHVEWSVSFLIPLLWLGIIISVIAQLIFYQLIQKSNLVNVTSLFYLVPVITVILDYLFLGNLLPLLSLLGMATILLGLGLVFHNTNK